MNYRHLKLRCIFPVFFLGAGFVFAQIPSKTEKIDHYLRKMRAKDQVPGFAIAVVTKDSVLFSKGYGVNGPGQAVTSKTPFAIASLSKAFTAMSVMQLAAAGKINLDEPVARYIPKFKLADSRGSEITVRQVLHQVSGLNDVVFPELAFDNEPENLDKSIERLRGVKLSSDPGERFRYHNPNYQILAKIVEAVSEKPFPNYLESNIFKPLRMSETKSVTSTKALNETFKNFSNGHIFAFGKSIAIQEPDWFIEGAAGTVSNADDMSKWLRLQLNHT